MLEQTGATINAELPSAVGFSSCAIFTRFLESARLFGQIN
jgi:hypothetical protein